MMRRLLIILGFGAICLTLTSCFVISLDPTNYKNNSTTTTAHVTSTETTTTTMKIITRPPDPDIVDFEDKKRQIDSAPWEMDNKEIQITGYLQYEDGAFYLVSRPGAPDGNLPWEWGAIFKLNNVQDKNKLFSGHKITAKGKISLQIDESGDKIKKSIICNHIELVK